jgi:hypothetical protein
LVPQYVDIGPSTHRADACVGPFPLEFDFGQCAADAAALSKKHFFRCVCVGGGGVMPTVRVACCTTAPYSCAAPVALQLAARHRSRVICHTWGGRSMDVVRRMLHVACCMLHAVRLLSHVACCHRSRQFRHARMRARTVQARTLLSVWPWPMRRSGAHP